MIEFQWLVNNESAGSLHLAYDNIAVIVWDNAYNGRLGTTEIIAKRFNSTGQIPPVGKSAPAKIEMKVIISLVSITNESMNPFSLPTIVNRMIGCKILPYQVVPFVIYFVEFKLNYLLFKRNNVVEPDEKDPESMFASFIELENEQEFLQAQDKGFQRVVKNHR